MVDRIVLVGMMGVGKTTVGSRLAQHLGWAYFDSDAQVMTATGRTVPELFAAEGEAAFRALESRVLNEALSGDEPVVVSAAGGVILSAANRRLMAESGIVVWMRADPSVLARRVGAGEGRPLLDADPSAVLADLDRQRRELYVSVAAVTIDVDDLTPQQVVDRLLADQAMTDAGIGPGSPPMRTVPVELGDRGYDVMVGAGVRHQLAERVAATVSYAAKAAVVTQAGIGVSVDPGIPSTLFEVPDGEGAKSFAVVEGLCREFAQAGIGRSDLVVAVGGGVVTDVAGFAAATFHRGMPYVNVATTLLGQVDAAIGGKTGVNLEEGKNLVGAFWQPKAVLCDTETLASLPPREWASGRGEMAKYALLGGTTGAELPLGAGLLDLPLDEQVACCAAVKAAVVASDELEGGRRAILNYGHTLAHALEASEFGPDARSDLRHGEAVAIGLVFAALLAQRLGRIEEERVALHRLVVGGFGLSSQLPEDADPERLVAFMARDKKAQRGLTFVLDGPAGVEPVPGIDPGDVITTLAQMERVGRDGQR